MTSVFHCATVETRNFSFQAFGRTYHDALRALRNGWRIHCQQYNIPLDWDYLARCVPHVHEVELDAAYRDSERLTQATPPKSKSSTIKWQRNYNGTGGLNSTCGKYRIRCGRGHGNQKWRLHERIADRASATGSTYLDGGIWHHIGSAAKQSTLKLQANTREETK